MERLWQDLRFGLRMLRKSPAFTAVAVLTLALGIGINTSMFSVIEATLLGGLPYPDAKRLVRVFRTSPQSQSWPHSGRDRRGPGLVRSLRRPPAVTSALAAEACVTRSSRTSSPARRGSGDRARSHG